MAETGSLRHALACQPVRRQQNTHPTSRHTIELCPWRGVSLYRKTTKGNPMAKRKPTITIEDFKDGWADAYAKLLRNRKFQQAIHSDGIEDSMETMWLIDKLMQGVLTEAKYEQLMNAVDDDIIDAWKYLSGKLPTITESPSKD